MLILALDSTSPAGSVAAWRDGRVLAWEPTDPARSFSEQLPGALLDLLADQGLRLGDVDVFAVASGPGSLTGLRVGIATIQGLAFAGSRPVVAVSALEALAYAALDASPERGEPAGHGAESTGGVRAVGAWQDARRGEVYSALYRAADEPREGASATDGGALARETLEELEGPAVGAPGTTVARWAARLADHAAGVRHLTLIGDAAMQPATAEAVRSLGDDVRLRVLAAPLLAGVVARRAAVRAARGEVVRPHAVQPLYVRRPDAELARERKNG